MNPGFQHDYKPGNICVVYLTSVTPSPKHGKPDWHVSSKPVHYEFKRRIPSGGRLPDNFHLFIPKAVEACA